MWWRMDESMGLHYGVWEEDTTSLRDAIINTNKGLMELGKINEGARVLDAGCGVGGSAILLAKTLGCQVTGITLSAKQVGAATRYAVNNMVGDKTHFEVMDYTDTVFAADTFDFIWAIESMQTGPDKAKFFKEVKRILKPGGKLLIADCFKAFPYDVDQEPNMLTMLNGWAMSDLLTIDEISKLAEQEGLKLTQNRDVTREIQKSVKAILRAALLGMVGTKLYNLYKKASYFSRIHYKTGLAQYKTYMKGLWTYNLIVIENTGA